MPLYGGREYRGSRIFATGKPVGTAENTSTERSSARTFTGIAPAGSAPGLRA